MDQVLQHALVRTPEPIEWDEAAAARKQPVTPVADDDTTGVVAH
jgi:ATP-dependent Lon protease